MLNLRGLNFCHGAFPASMKRLLLSLPVIPTFLLLLVVAYGVRVYFNKKSISNNSFPNLLVDQSKATYNRDSWDYDSSTARERLRCAENEHVDHIVALKEAFDSGASNWTSERKEKFANDPLNQMCLDASLNMSKSDGDLAEWDGGSCSVRKQIAKKTIKVKNKYGLSIDSAEKRANTAAINKNCYLSNQ